MNVVTLGWKSEKIAKVSTSDEYWYSKIKRVSIGTCYQQRMNSLGWITSL